jgi:uncharacterized protein with von Willebrand factor type A (vWA) domain
VAERGLGKAGRRFRRYDGGDPLAAPVDIARALDAIGDSVMGGTSPERAMREYLRRGDREQLGLDDLARRVSERRRELLQRNNLDGTLQEVQKLLERAVLEEKKQLARDVTLDELDRSFSEMRLENLPASTSAAVSELSDYDWKSSQARADYAKIQELLGRELLDQRFAGMKQALEGATDEDREAIGEMLNDLNELLAKRAAGTDTPEDFAEFMEKNGQYFPENPRNLDELLDTMAKRSAAAQRAFNSMTPEQQQELMRLSAQAFGSPSLLQALSQLDANLQSLRPGEDWTGSQNFDGDNPMGLGDATGVMQDLADLDRLADQLAQSYSGARMDDIDLDAISRQLGTDAAVDARTLRELEKALRDGGTLRRDSAGRLQLTPKAMRQLGTSLLKDVATRMHGRAGQRETRNAGSAGDLTGGSRAWDFGDTEAWDIPRTILNGVQRRLGAGVAPGASVSGMRGRLIEVDDIEVAETEARSQAAVALLVDTSFSMAMDGRWVPMKRTALALHTLIKSRFRGDHLELISFGRHAEVMDIEQLTALDSYWDKGTNLHHALLLANRHFRKHPNAQPVLLIVTDGEPTAHLEKSGEVFFSFPPHPVTIERSIQELDTSMRLGAQTTFFRLGDDRGLARFVDSMARRAGGRVVAPELDDLGAAVVESYLGGRSSRAPGAASGSMGDEQGGYFGRGWWV